MAWPDPGRTATWDKTTGSMGRTVDPILYPMLTNSSPILDRIARESVDNSKFEWESANTRGKTFVSAAANGSTAITGSATGTKIGCGSGIGLTLQKGSIIRNASVATPIGTHQVDEIMMVTANDATDITVKRNYAQPVGSTKDNGSTAHTATATYEVLFSPKEEGSSPDENKYQDVSLVANYTNILDFYLTATGSQLANKRLNPADNMQRQFEDRLVELKNEMESMLLYGAVNPGSGAQGADTEANAWAGTDAYVRTTKGIQNFLAVTGGNVDYTTLSVTEDALNGLFQTIVENGNNPNDDYLIVCHPQNARVISTFGADKVQITRVDKGWGRYVTSFLSDLGITADVAYTLNCSKSDLFVLNTRLIKVAEFRPFMKFEWGIDTSSPDGTDAYKQRYLGEYGVKVINGSKSHGLLTKISWT